VDWFGRYKILCELWRGSVGVVYIERFQTEFGLDRVDLLKHFTACTAAEDIAAFIAEMRPVEKLNHMNLVQVLNVDVHEGAPFLVQEIVWGGSFARLLRGLHARGKTLEPRLAAWIVHEAAHGLDVAHRLFGVLHGDISPSSLMISLEGEVKVGDFGVAKYRRSGRPPRSSAVRTKFAYLSPEQTWASPLDQRSDVFSLGIVLHEALTGRPLFAARSAAEMIRRVREEPAPDPRSIRPEVPAEMAAIAQRCLEKDRRARYATAREVAAELACAMLAQRAGSAAAQEIAEALSLSLDVRRAPQRKLALRQRMAEIFYEHRTGVAHLAKEIFGEELAALEERVRVVYT
jgi:eukaryotic-like serine/threonine-protein kinase